MVVVNHHLFFADVVLRDEGVAELLPDVQHGDLRRGAPPARPRARSSSASTSTTGNSWSSRATPKQSREPNCATSPICPMRARRSFRSSAGFGLPRAKVRGKFAQQVVAERPDFVDALDALAAGLDRLSGARWQLFAERSEDVAVIARRAEAAAEALSRWKAGLRTEDAGGEAWIRWIDVGPQGFQLHASPLSVADVFRRQVEQTGRAWIFTSATLAVGRDFTHYTDSSGSPTRRPVAGKARSTTPAGAAVRAAGTARAEQHRAHDRGRRTRRLPVCRPRRPRVLAFHVATAR